MSSSLVITTIEKDVARSKGGDIKDRFRCHCGKEFITRRTAVKRGSIKSCGCLKGRHLIKHRESGNNITPEYRLWKNISNRCCSKMNRKYHRYGGRGITVCDRWRASYLDFLADIGRRPDKSYSLDRIDNDGNYEPSNCRWATSSEQNLNRGKFNIKNR